MNSNGNKVEVKYLAYYFSVKLLKFVGGPPQTNIYYVINNQLMRSATSIGANIVEAQSASSKKDFIKFYDISLKSSNETKYWLALLRDTTEADKNIISTLIKEAIDLSNILGASLLTLKKKR